MVDVISDIDGLIYNIEDNNVAIAWSAMDKSLNMKQGDLLFKLKIQLTETGSQLLSSGLDIATSIISDPVSLIADDNAERVPDVRLAIPAIQSTLSNSQFAIRNYPNPFNNTTVIEYNLPQQSNVVLRIYNILGMQISEPVNTNQSAGDYKVNFDGTALPAVTYSYRLDAAGMKQNYTQTKMMILAK